MEVQEEESQSVQSPTLRTAINDSILTVSLTKEENDVLDKLIQWVETLRTKDDIDQIKTKVLYEITESTLALKHMKSKEENKKTIKQILKKVFDSKELIQKFRKFLLLRERDRPLRESCIRVLKMIIKTSKKLSPLLKECKIHIFVAFLLEREFKSSNVAKERMQCLKFINAWLTKSPNNFPYIFAQILVSMSKNIEDPLRKKAVEYLLYMCTQCPETSANVGAIRFLIDCLLDLSLSGIRYDLIAQTVLLLVNDPKTRLYLRHFQDLNKIFAIFTTVDGVDKDPKKDILDKIIAQMGLASKSIVNIMRSWNGVIYLASSPLGLQSLINSLTQPTRLYKKLAILDTFTDIFNIPIYIASSESTSMANQSVSLSGRAISFNENLLNNYAALLLQAFQYNGIYEALINLGTTTEEGSELNKKSKFLLKKIMYLSSYLLPEVPHFPQLLKIATDFSHDNQNTRTRATKMIKELSTISLKNPLELSKQNEVFGGSSHFTTKDFSMLFMRVYEYFNSMQLGLPFNTVISNYLVDLKAFYYSDVDDNRFNIKIKQSGVLQQKDFRKWNWLIINEILEGNLLTPARLEEVMKKTKFIKRILNFFMPSKNQFINMEWREENLIFARSGYNLIKTLLSSKEGQKALSSSPGVFFMFGLTFVENKDNIFHHRKSFIQELCDILEREVNYLVKSRSNYGKKVRRFKQQAPPNAGSSTARSSNAAFGQNTSYQQIQNQLNTPSGSGSIQLQSAQTQIGATEDQRFFTKKRLIGTMFREYISWLGLFTTTKDGIKLMKKFKIYEHLSQLVDNNGYYDHFNQIILQSFDFGFSRQTRSMLEAWTRKCSPSLAKSIIELFRMQFRSGLVDFYYWCLPQLNQLIGFGNYEEIAEAAFDVLEEVCIDQNSLNQLLVVNEKILDSLKDVEQSDLFIAKFLRSQKGFKLLKQEGWLQRKLKEWKEKGNQDYIVKLERNLYEGLNMKEMNSQMQSHAMSIWIPIYEHSNDFRNELMTLKRYPYIIQIKVENLQNEVIVLETLQTYIECDSDNQLQIVGKIINKHSKLYNMPIENYYYISVCMKLGSCYVDARSNECKDPIWTIIDINDKNKISQRNNRFKIFKNGIFFNFCRGSPAQLIIDGKSQEINQTEEQMRKIFLDSIIFKVQILPQKYKIIKTPIHLYGELVQTEEGANFLAQTGDLDYFKNEITNPETPLLKKRAALWAIGHIGSTQYGFRLIRDADVMREIIKMAESAEILSLRGTSIYILGLISQSKGGRDLIHSHNWVSSYTQGISVCLPRDPSVLFRVSDYTFKGDIAQNEEFWGRVDKINEGIVLSKEEQDIVKLIGNLINGVTEMQALNDLRKILDKERQKLQNPKILEHVLMLLSIYRFKPKARKFIFNMFEDVIFNDQMLYDHYIDL